MAKSDEKKRALDLRREGKSYSDTRAEIGVSKSTLSNWLRDYPLSTARMRELRDWNQHKIERYRQTRKANMDRRLEDIFVDEKKRMLPLTVRDIRIGGLFLYWGEGAKTRMTSLSISNTDPAAIRAFIDWLKLCYDIDSRRIVFRLHLYADMDIEKEVGFWSRAIRVPQVQFKRPYIKRSARQSLTYRNGFGHGTCNAILCNAELAKRVLMQLRMLQEYFGPVA